MFSFGKKKVCDVCGSSARQTKLRDGSFCDACFTECRYFLVPEEVINYKDLSVSTLRDAYANYRRSNELFKIFNVTRSVENYFFVDDTNNLWEVIDNTYNENKRIVFSFDDVESFELLQDEETILTGGLKSAIVGSLIADMKVKQLMKKLQIRVNLKNMRPYYINILKGPGYGLSIKSGTAEYDNAINEAGIILDIFNSHIS